MRYVRSKYAEHERDLAYRIYVCDSLWASGNERRLDLRFAEMLKPKAPNDERSGAEIAVDVIGRLGLKVE